MGVYVICVLSVCSLNPACILSVYNMYTVVPWTSLFVDSDLNHMKTKYGQWIEPLTRRTRRFGSRRARWRCCLLRGSPPWWWPWFPQTQVPDWGTILSPLESETRVWETCHWSVYCVEHTMQTERGANRKSSQKKHQRNVPQGLCTQWMVCFFIYTRRGK